VDLQHLGAGAGGQIAEAQRVAAALAVGGVGGIHERLKMKTIFDREARAEMSLILLTFVCERVLLFVFVA
jgi:hypothetical protein